MTQGSALAIQFAPELTLAGTVPHITLLCHSGFVYRWPCITHYNLSFFVLLTCQDTLIGDGSGDFLEAG